MLIFSHSPIGYEGDLITVEVDMRRGIPGMDIVGLPDGAVKEAKERVRTAIKSSGLDFPLQRILVNLAPADIRKIGSAFDLSIAMGVLSLTSQLPPLSEPFMVLGELSLGGQVRWVQGVLPAINLGLQKGIRHFIIPKENFQEASIFPQAKILALADLKSIHDALKAFPKHFLETEPAHQGTLIPDRTIYGFDFAHIKGQEYTKRAIEIAASGRHHILLAGPPGAGKTLCARCFRGILPFMTFDEAKEVTQVYSLAGKIPQGEGLLTQRPFRHPHHSSSLEGLVGGGHIVLPGEVSLAHRGVLFLDEALEFKKRILQGLREPLEDKYISIVRAGRSYSFPCDFQLFLTANLCPCSNLGKEDSFCGCSSLDVQNYWKRLGGALLDRIDIRVKVVPTHITTLLDHESESSKDIRKRINEGYLRQRERYKNENISTNNGTLNNEQIERFCPLTRKLKDVLNNVLVKFNLSSRAVHSILKVSRTIADLAGQEEIERDHLFEAIQHRRYAEDLDDL